MDFRSEAERIDSWERGVLYVVLTLNGSERDCLRIAGPGGEQCAIWARALAAQEKLRQRMLDQWKSEAWAALPSEMANIHPSWLAAALADEPSHVVRAIHSVLPASLRVALADSTGTVTACSADDADPNHDASAYAMARALARQAFAHLMACCEPAGPLAEELCRMRLADRLAAVTARGARAIGHSLVGQDARDRARIMAAMGEPWSNVIGQASRQDIARPQLKAALAAASVALPASVRTVAERLLHIGLAALGPELAAEHPQSAARVAVHLPVELGRRLHPARL